MLKLQQRHSSPYWYIRGTVRGQSVDESTGTTIKKAAEEVRVKREAELLEQSIHGRRVTMTFSQAALSYLELGGDKRFMAPVLKHFGTTKLARIGQHEIDNAAKKLYPSAAPSTLVRQVYTPVSAVLQHAAKRGWCTVQKLERPELPEGRVRWLTKDEAERLIAACAPHLRPLVIFLLYTGARCGEALWITWKDIDLNSRHVSFINTKNGTNRGVPLHHRVVSELDVLRTNRVTRQDRSRDGGANVFTTQAGSGYGTPVQSDGSDSSAGSRIKSAFGGAVRRAGLRDFHPHDCRHTWATWHYQANRDLGALQRLGGWKTLSMVMRYAHTNVAELSSTIDRI